MTPQAIYNRKRGAGTTPGATRGKLGQLARGRALERLRERYPEDFRNLLDDERAALGLEPVGS